MISSVNFKTKMFSIFQSNQTILGVMGTDVTTKQMEKFSPVWKVIYYLMHLYIVFIP